MDELLKKYQAVLSISDVAEILNITPATVRRHIKSNDLPHIKVGRLVRIPKDSLIGYLHGDPSQITLVPPKATPHAMSQLGILPLLTSLIAASVKIIVNIGMNIPF